ncbi:ERCC4 domain-containing protein [Durotheca rogersii]|uniref:ERCC4 domain-containing protein n=1 Tax=Durotheca rogersii TaxID=419775 RepID=UPI00221F7912|nr:ERCC4 domain-containing protein [Durotheca rogersii]KAI5864012.1 ERCC4 domain-containing protein [Durotheca rogersii]
MPTEVIDLLSSSPLASPRAFAGISAHNYGDLEQSTASSDKKAGKLPDRIPDRPATTLRKTGGTERFRQDDDALFLSDDLDSLGDEDDGIVEKTRAPAAATGSKERVHGFKRAKSDVMSSKATGSLPRTGLKRWSSVLDPIETSSSPNRPIATKRQKTTTNNDVADPFNSPPKRTTHTKSCRVNLSSDPFKSSPERDADSHRPSAVSRPREPISDDPFQSPVEPSGDAKTKSSVLIILSDDIVEDSPGGHLATKSRRDGAWDPISSSMPERSGRNKAVSLAGSDADSEDLPDLCDIDFSQIKPRRRSLSLSFSPPRRKAEAARSTTTARKPPPAEPRTAQEKEAERRKKAAAREADKERKRVEKEQAKAQRAAEHEREKALAEVNKLRTDKKVSATEMIADLPTSLGAGLRAQIEKLLGDLGVQCAAWDSPVANVIKWRRKVASAYNEALGHWEPAPAHVRDDEEHVLVVVAADEFVELVLGPAGRDLDAHVCRVKAGSPGRTPIYLIEGLGPWMRKNKNLLNRQFASAVRGLDDAPPSSSSAPQQQQPSSRRRRGARAPPQQHYVDEDMIEDALLALQVEHGALIHHTAAGADTASWVASFTQHVSTVPYRRAREAAGRDAGFCMAAGQVRGGADARDTYVRALGEIARVAAPAAHGVAAAYPSLPQLVRGLEARGPLALEACRRAAGPGAAAGFTDRTLGPALSRRLYKIFTGTDPASLDV